MATLEENKALVKKMQSRIFEMLCYIDDFCKKYHITYFLSGGSCLGAVRHKGFIPWDDDADLMMPREDYERFIRLFKKYGKKYKVSSLATDKDWNIKQAKVWDSSTRLQYINLEIDKIGLFIDIFPIDGVPENKYKRKLHYKFTKLLSALGSSSIKTGFTSSEKYHTVKIIAKVFTKNVQPRKFYELMDKTCKKYSFKTSKYVGAVIAAHYGERETIRREYMEKAVYLPFEGRKFPVPIGYKKYLSNLYGNYMEIPKDAEENGFTHLDSWKVEFLDED